jgi:hypothetical protein
MTVTADGQMITNADHFEFVLNGRVMNARGANLIPSDSIPWRMTRESSRTLLRDMKAANVNMVRRWGGFDVQPMNSKMSQASSAPESAAITIMRASRSGAAITRTKVRFSGAVRHRREFHSGCNQYKKFNRWEKAQIEGIDSSRGFWRASPSDGT